MSTQMALGFDAASTPAAVLAALHAEVLRDERQPPLGHPGDRIGRRWREMAAHLKHIALAAARRPDVAAAYAEHMVIGKRVQMVLEEQSAAEREVGSPGRKEFETMAAESREALAIYERARAQLPAAASLHVDVPLDGDQYNTSLWAYYKRHIHNTFSPRCLAGVMVRVEKVALKTGVVWRVWANIHLPERYRPALGHDRRHATLDEALAVGAWWRGLGDALFPPETVVERVLRRRARRGSAR